MSRIAKHRLRAITLCALFAAAVPAARARIGLIVGEPFGRFGAMLPVGHAGIYLDHLCADTPTHLRPCQPGELGVVVARYHDLKDTHTDWLAIPAYTFFYGVESPAQVPAYVTKSIKNELRESYRQAHLQAVVPLHHGRHGSLHSPLDGDWAEGIGAAFDRRLFIYTFATTAEQDAAILHWLNADANIRHYAVHNGNCADFATHLLLMALPHQNPPVLHHTRLNDFDDTTPKTVARQLNAYGTIHPEIELRTYIVPQIPGTLPRSRPLRGDAELFLTTKPYLFSLLLLQPEFILADWIVYEKYGKWKPSLETTILSTTDLSVLASAPPNQSSASTDSSTVSDLIGLQAK